MEASATSPSSASTEREGTLTILMHCSEHGTSINFYELVHKPWRVLMGCDLKNAQISCAACRKIVYTSATFSIMM